MDKMTNGERVAYAHGRVKADMNDIRETAADLHLGIQAAYSSWANVLVGGLVVLVMAAAPLFLLPNLQWYKYVYVAVSIMVFLVARLVSYHRIQDVLKVANLIDSVIHSLSNTQTLRIGFEGMQQMNKEQKAKEDDAK